VSRYALLGSPFLGPEVWEPTAAALRARGHRADVVASTAGDDADSILEVLAAALPRSLAGDDLVLVPHSNAGLYVAALVARRPVTALVFVDALLPGEAPASPVASADLVEQLRPLADATGRLPVWTRWWPEEDVADLLRDTRHRASVERGQRRLPLAYLESTVPSPAGWERLPAAYLGFGEAYAAEQARARAAGWPVSVLPGRHLHPVVEPSVVAQAVTALHAKATTQRR
jgi:hypothetical protein